MVPQHRSKGVGSQLLQEAEARVRRAGYSRIGLGVAVDNIGARRLYQREGYEDAGFGEYNTGGCYVDRDGEAQTWEEICCYLVKLIQSNRSEAPCPTMP